jgi:uncharacterized protein YndB with AHSA1/START domain
MPPVLIVAVPVLMIAVGGFIASRPSTFRVQRQATMSAPPATVFALVNDFHQWVRWSPWENRDPDLKRIYSGAESGAGAIYAWTGNRSVGEGRMTITESQPGELVRIKLEFIKPFVATNTTEFALMPEGGRTTVVWSMIGTNNFMAKLMGLFMNMDKMVGGDFEKGLEGMKKVAESTVGL